MCLSAVALVAGSAAVAGSDPIGVTVLPRPDGPHRVGETVVHLVDSAREDPFHPDRQRELMVSVFYPAEAVEGHPRAHYLSTALIPDMEERFGLEIPGLLTNSYTGAPALAGGPYPVILYSPGAGDTRIYGTGLAEDLASRGYVVVTVDPTYESTVEFPGGRVERPAPLPGGFDRDIRKKFIAARLLDIRFVLDSLARIAGGDNPDAGHRALPAGLDHALDLERVGMVGHSSGGYTAVESLHDDRRIDAAVDLDGQIGVDEEFGRAAAEGVDRPVLVMTSGQIEEVGDANPSLAAFWTNATGWKRQLTLRDSAHYDYTDFPALVPAIARPAVARYIGPIAADRATSLVRTYVAAMFDKFLRDRTDTPLDRQPAEPEIVVTR
ncbi:alpha/beta hydrolase family protein [Nocardia sp. NPDC057668]|uniref:alpha/beta hydrolase family protein n=1 Tax=Nocardia sp. NPDC057668 TaxID=3346202 RepID=UPI00366B169B